MVPFDIHGLADAMGGDPAMAGYLDTDLSSFDGTPLAPLDPRVLVQV